MRKDGATEEEIREALPTADYLRKVTKEEFPDLKFPKETRMAKCDICALLR